MVAPAAMIALVTSATGWVCGAPSTRMVIPYPGLVDAMCYTTPYSRSPASPKPGTM